MSDDSELIERTLSITQVCLLPKLNEDFDTKAIASSDFETFKIISNENIHLLLDILYKNQFLLTEKVYDNQIQQIRVNLLLITCEQIEENPYFRSDDKMLLQSLWKITADHIQSFEDKIYNQTIDHYKSSLTKNEWKKSFGLFHGFPMFCKIMLQYKAELVNDDLILFILSIGSNLVSHYEPYYKTIGLKIYMYLLQFGGSRQLKDLNIHQVIYSEALPLIERSNEMDYNIYMYECLYLTLTIDNIELLTDSKWCKYDDVMSKLLKHFSFENDIKLSKFLIYQIVKFIGAGFGRDLKLKPFKELEEVELKYINELKTKFNHPNLRISRWTSKIMELMIRESLRLLNNSEDAKFFLYTYNIIYVLSVASMKPEGFQQKLEDFTKKYIIMLMKVVKTFKGDKKILELVLNTISTIEQHQSGNEELMKVLERIKSHDMLRIT